MTDLWGLTPGGTIVNAGTLPATATGSAYASYYALAQIGTTTYLFCVAADDTTLEVYSLSNTNPAVATLVTSDIFTILGSNNYVGSAVAIGSTIYILVGNWEWNANVAFKGELWSFDGATLSFVANTPGATPGGILGTDGTDLYCTSVNDPGSPTSNAEVWILSGGAWSALAAPSGQALANFNVCGAATIGTECVFFGTSENEPAAGWRPSAFKVTGSAATSLGFGTAYTATGETPNVYFVSGCLSFNSLGYCVYHDWNTKDDVWQVDPATGTWTLVESFSQSGSLNDTKCGLLLSYSGSIYTPLKQNSSAGVALYKSPGTTVTDPWTEVTTEATDLVGALTGLVF